MSNTEQLDQKIETLVGNLQRIHDGAIELFTPMAQDLCHRIAKEDEVECFFNERAFLLLGRYWKPALQLQTPNFQ